MAIEFKSKSYAGKSPVFWRGEAKILPAGFQLKQTFPAGTRIPRGTFLEIEIGTLKAAVVKHLNVVSGGTTQKPRVQKGSLIQVGDVLMKEGEKVSVTVSSVDSSNREYDVVNLSSAITGLTAGDMLVEAKAVSSDAAEAKYEPNSVVGEITDPLAGSDQDTVSAAYDCVVLLGYIPDFPKSWLVDPVRGMCLKNNPNIVFAKQ